MDIKEELQSAIAKRQEIVDRVNQIEQEKQKLLQEALRFDGEVRVLQRMNKTEAEKAPAGERYGTEK